MGIYFRRRSVYAVFCCCCVCVFVYKYFNLFGVYLFANGKGAQRSVYILEVSRSYKDKNQSFITMAMNEFDERAYDQRMSSLLEDGGDGIAEWTEICDSFDDMK